MGNNMNSMMHQREMMYQRDMRMPRTRMPEPCNNGCDMNRKPCDDDCSQDRDMIYGMPLAMAYVPWQRFGCTYEPEQALQAGTIFPELDLPFYGRRGMRV